PSRSGDAVRDREGVPLGMLISLLKNAKGEVKLAVPISGNDSSRQLNFDDAFWEAVRKTAVGVATLPLSWVGKIFYSEDARVETGSIWPGYFEGGRRVRAGHHLAVLLRGGQHHFRQGLRPPRRAPGRLPAGGARGQPLDEV